MQHNEHCPVEATLELIGGKYKALILWRLSEGKLRFSELRDQIKGVTPKMLTQQLRELEAKEASVAWERDKRSVWYILFSASGFTAELVKEAESRTDLVLCME